MSKAKKTGARAPKDGGIKARVLVAVTIDGELHEANDVVEVTQAELDAYGSALDATPAAVEYAESIA